MCIFYWRKKFFFLQALRKLSKQDIVDGLRHSELRLSGSKAEVLDRLILFVEKGVPRQDRPPFIIPLDSESEGAPEDALDSDYDASADG